VKGRTYKRCACGTLTDAAGRRVNCTKKHGSWAYAHDLPAGADGRRRQTRVAGFATEREARAAMLRSMEDAQRSSTTPNAKIKVGEYLDDWLLGKGGLRSATRRSYTEHVRLYFAPALGHIRLAQLQDRDIERLYAAMRSLGTDAAPTPLVRQLLGARRNTEHVRPLSAASIRRVHATLMSALNSAVKRKLLRDNPAQHVELPSGRRPRAVVWTPESSGRNWGPVRNIGQVRQAFGVRAALLHRQPAVAVGQGLGGDAVTGLGPLGLGERAVPDPG
jgi:hypothetical protein